MPGTPPCPLRGLTAQPGHWPPPTACRHTSPGQAEPTGPLPGHESPPSGKIQPFSLTKAPPRLSIHLSLGSSYRDPVTGRHSPPKSTLTLPRGFPPAAPGPQPPAPSLGQRLGPTLCHTLCPCRPLSPCRGLPWAPEAPAQLRGCSSSCLCHRFKSELKRARTHPPPFFFPARQGQKL